MLCQLPRNGLADGQVSRADDGNARDGGHRLVAAQHRAGAYQSRPVGWPPLGQASLGRMLLVGVQVFIHTRVGSLATTRSIPWWPGSERRAPCLLPTVGGLTHEFDVTAGGRSEVPWRSGGRLGKRGQWFGIASSVAGQHGVFRQSSNVVRC